MATHSCNLQYSCLILVPPPLISSILLTQNLLQVTSRLKLEVEDRSMASFIEWAGNASSPETWTGFTNSLWGTTPDLTGFAAWVPRVSSLEGASRFRDAARATYPEIPGGVNITRRSDDGSGFVEAEETFDSTADLWPVLYMNPRNDSVLGFNIASDAASASAIDLMLATESTSIATAPWPLGEGQWAAGAEGEQEGVEGGGNMGVGRHEQSGLSVAQPVFAQGNISQGEIVGCTIAETSRVCDVVINTLKTFDFPQKYPDADVAVFLQSADGGGIAATALVAAAAAVEAGATSQQPALASGVEYTGELLVDVSVSDLEWCIDPRDGAASVPPITAGRCAGSLTSVVSLTVSSDVVMVMSFKPRWYHRHHWMGMKVVILGCVASALVAVLTYRREVRLLAYRDRMEEAIIHSELKSRFAADLSHEIRNVLHGILGAGELLVEQTMPQGAKELAATIQDCGLMLMGM